LLATSFDKSFKIVFSSDEERFSGDKRVVAGDQEYFNKGNGHRGRPNSFMAYLPSLTVLVFAPFNS